MKTTGLKSIDETINPAEPTKALLDEWSDMTAGNCHSERLVKVAKWATDNCREDSGLIPTFKAIKDSLTLVFEEHEKTGHLTWENGLRRTRLLGVLHAAIKMEYGEETTAKIDAN